MIVEISGSAESTDDGHPIETEGRPAPDGDRVTDPDVECPCQPFTDHRLVVSGRLPPGSYPHVGYFFVRGVVDASHDVGLSVLDLREQHFRTRRNAPSPKRLHQVLVDLTLERIARARRHDDAVGRPRQRRQRQAERYTHHHDRNQHRQRRRHRHDRSQSDQLHAEHLPDAGSDAVRPCDAPTGPAQRSGRRPSSPDCAQRARHESDRKKRDQNRPQHEVVGRRPGHVDRRQRPVVRRDGDDGVDQDDAECVPERRPDGGQQRGANSEQSDQPCSRPARRPYDEQGSTPVANRHPGHAVDGDADE